MTTATKKTKKITTKDDGIYSFYGGKVKIQVKPWGDYFRYIKVYDESDSTGDKTGMLSPSAVTKHLDKSRALLPWAVGLVCTHITSYFESKKGDSFHRDEIFQLVAEARLKPEEKKVEGGSSGDLIHDYALAFGKAVMSDSKLPTLDHLDHKDPMQLKAINGINAFLEFYNNNEVEFLEMEDPIYYNSFYAGESKAGEPVIEFAGRRDLFARINGQLEVVDYKSSKGVYSDQRYQVSGYFKAHNTNAPKELQAKGYRILNFGKDTGDLIEKFVSAEEAEKDFNAFKGLHAVALREKELDAEYFANKKNESK